MPNVIFQLQFHLYLLPIGLSTRSDKENYQYARKGGEEERRGRGYADWAEGWGGGLSDERVDRGVRDCVVY